MPTSCPMPVGLQALVLAMAFTATAAGQTVWSGLTYSFTKEPFANHLLPANQDAITDGVVLTRGETEGLFNILAEEKYQRPTFTSPSPLGTEWATDAMFENTEKTVAAANWQELTFTNFAAAHGGQFGLANTIVGTRGVLHLIDEDIYLDIEFTGWSVGSGAGGGFSYMRAVAPSTGPTGDYNGDGTVDAADYTVWRDTFGQSVTSPGSGADGDESGEIDAGDYQYWKDRFGQVVSGGGAAAIAVPEPATIASILGGLFALATGRQRITPRGPGQNF